MQQSCSADCHASLPGTTYSFKVYALRWIADKELGLERTQELPLLHADEVFGVCRDPLVVPPDIAEVLQGQMRALEFRRSECLKMMDALVESDTHATG